MTLADDWINVGRRGVEAVDRALGVSLLGYDRLKSEVERAQTLAREEGREGVFDEVGETLLSTANVRATRYVFEDDLVNSLLDALDNRNLDMATIARHARPPSRSTWIESVTHVDSGGSYREGVLLTHVRDDTYRATCVLGKGRGSQTTARALAMVEFDLSTVVVEHAGKYAINCRDLFVAPYEDPELGVQAARNLEGLRRSAVAMALYGVFLIVHPKTIEVVAYEPTAKLQRARVKRGKQPFLSYQSVRLRIGAVETRRDGSAVSTGGSSTQARRYHHVVGYFRTRNRGRPNERVEFIDELWRGDPSMGIIIRDRKVKLEKVS